MYEILLNQIYEILLNQKYGCILCDYLKIKEPHTRSTIDPIRATDIFLHMTNM